MKIVTEVPKNLLTGEYEGETIFFEKEVDALGWLIDSGYSTYRKADNLNIYYKQVTDSIKEFAYFYKNMENENAQN